MDRNSSNKSVTVFLLPGKDQEKESILGRTIKSGSWIVLYEGASASVLAHELGHICGLDDEYIYRQFGPSIPGTDKDNVMNMGTGDLASRHFRYEQWIQANKSEEK